MKDDTILSIVWLIGRPSHKRWLSIFVLLQSLYKISTLSWVTLLLSQVDVHIRGLNLCMMDICNLLGCFSQHNILGIELKWQTILQRSLADKKSHLQYQ